VEAAAEGGHLHVIKWLHDGFGRVLFGMEEKWLATENEHLEVLQWLIAHSMPAPSLSLDMTAHPVWECCVDPIYRCRTPPSMILLTTAGATGRLDIVLWLAGEIDMWFQARAESNDRDNDGEHASDVSEVVHSPSSRVDGFATATYDFDIDETVSNANLIVLV
jgi:hypothetical protein